MQGHFEADGPETGRRLGHDLYRFGTDPGPQALTGSLREGYLHAAATVPRATADRFVRKWLQLRLGAWRRGRAFDESVTPRRLSEIDVPTCPVTRTVLTHGELKDSDWSIDRLNNDGAYALNNLAVMSTRANKAKGGRRFDEVCALSGMSLPAEGLAPVEWQRLAALMLGPCFALSPGAAPLIPEVVPISAHRLMLGMQQFQQLLCNAAKTQSGKNALLKAFRKVSPEGCPRVKLEQLMEAVHASLKTVDPACDIWLQERVMRALLEWRRTLRSTQWGAVAEVSRALCGAHAVSPRRLSSWQLATGGYREDAAPQRHRPPAASTGAQAGTPCPSQAASVAPI